MLKSITFLVALFMGVLFYSQVGVNTTNPQATLDVVGKPADASKADGIIAPRMTASQLFAKNAVYAAAQNGTLVYITNANLTPTQLDDAKVSDVTTTGYYSFNGEKWLKFAEGEVERTTVFFNGNDPNTATTFSLEPPIDDDGNPNPLFVNDPSLEKKASYEYNGQDGSNWTWNGTVYVTKLTKASTPFYRGGSTTDDAGSNKTGIIWRLGRVGIGNQAKNPETVLHVFNDYYAEITLQGQTNIVRGRRGGGSGQGSVRTPINTTTGATLMDIRGAGFINSEKWTDQGSIRIVAVGPTPGTGTSPDPLGTGNWVFNNKPTQIEFHTTPRGSSSLTRRMTLTEAGTLLINRNALSSDCTACAIQAAGGLVLGGSTAVKPGGGSFTAPSDARIKKDVKPFSQGLEAVLQLKPVTYKYNKLAGIEDSNEDYVGFLAQEVEKIAPYMVKKIDDTKGSSGLPDKRILDESALTKILVNAIKEQQVQIDALKKEIKDLKAKKYQSYNKK